MDGTVLHPCIIIRLHKKLKAKNCLQIPNDLNIVIVVVIVAVVIIIIINISIVALVLLLLHCSFLFSGFTLSLMMTDT